MGNVLYPHPAVPAATDTQGAASEDFMPADDAAPSSANEVARSGATVDYFRPWSHSLEHEPQRSLRFAVGTQVIYNSGSTWEPGEIVGHWYHPRGFAPDFRAPYKLLLASGRLTFVPDDVEELCRARPLTSPAVKAPRCRISDLHKPATWWENALVGSSSMVVDNPGEDIDQRNYMGVTALSECACAGAQGLAQTLLDLGADPNCLDITGRGPLHHAVASGRATPEQADGTVRVLLEARADPNAQDTDFENDFSSKTFKERKRHRTALHYCAEHGYVSAAGSLLGAAADPNILDGQYKLALHIAVDEPSRDMVALLLANRSDPDIGNTEIGLTSSYLMVAARNGDEWLARALIGSNAKVNQVDKKQGMTPLHLAVRSRKEGVARLLIEARADASIKAMGKTAAEMAAANGQAALAALLDAPGPMGSAYPVEI